MHRLIERLNTSVELLGHTSSGDAAGHSGGGEFLCKEFFTYPRTRKRLGMQRQPNTQSTAMANDADVAGSGTGNIELNSGVTGPAL
jgi:hypothetical protein